MQNTGWVFLGIRVNHIKNIDIIKLIMGLMLGRRKAEKSLVTQSFSGRTVRIVEFLAAQMGETVGGPTWQGQ